MYSIDTSALIDAWNGDYTKEVIPGLWESIEKLVEKGLLIATEEVFIELERGYDDLCDWAKENKYMFIPLDEEIQIHAGKIINEFRGLVKEGRERSRADAFVIGLAMMRKCKVITSERAKTKKTCKIPYVCKHYGLSCLNLIDLCKEEGWKFVISR